MDYCDVTVHHYNKLKAQLSLLRETETGNAAPGNIMTSCSKPTEVDSSREINDHTLRMLETVNKSKYYVICTMIMLNKTNYTYFDPSS